MLQLFDRNKNKVKGLIKYKDYKVESVLSSGDKVLSFSYPYRLGKEIEEEGYIRNKTDEFVIKHIDSKNGWLDITATMNVEDLEGQTWPQFNTTEVTIADCLTTAIAGTGWSVKVNGTITKKRTVKLTNKSTWDVIQEAKKTYRVEIKFDTLNKIVQVYEKLGSNKGAYFIDSLNLKELGIQGDSYDFYTKLIAYGKDDITVTVENHQYSNKVKTLIWKDERYTDINSLKEDATYKLDEISKPRKAYSADILDLANMNEKYKNILSYSLGDTVTLIDSEKDIKDKQRIVKIIEYPEDPEKNSCELANTKLNFEDVQKEEKEAVDTINNITSDNGTIAESALRGILDNLNSKYISVTTLNAVTARIGTLETSTLKTNDFTAYKATITDLFAKKADIDVLNAGIERVKIIEGKVADFDNVLAKNITADNIKAGAITAGSGIIADGAIGSAQISSLDVTKLNAGIIDTTKISLAGANSRLTIKGNRLQVFDMKDNKLFERVSIGDINNDGSIFGIRVRGDGGKTNLFDENGVTAEGFTDGYNKLDNDSLDPSKIDIQKVVTRINNGTTTIQSSKILMNNTSLDVQFQKLTSDLQGQLDTQTTQISANTKAITAKLDTQTYTSKMTALDGSIATITDNLSKTTSSITALQDSIKLKVSSDDVTNILTKQHIALSFKDVVNGVFDGNNFTKNSGGTAWNAGFASVNIITNGQYVEYTVSKLNNRVMLGLSSSNKDANYTTIDYAIYVDYSVANNVITQILKVYEKSVYKGSFGSVDIGDQLRISIERNVVLYYRNGELFYTSLITPTLPMVIDTSFYDQGSEMRDIKIGSTMSGIATRINSTESDITQLKNSITLKVEKSDITSAINDAKKNIQSQIDIVYSQLKIDTNGISQVVSKITKDTSDNTTRLNSLETNITANAITTTITNGIDNGTASIKTTKFTMDINGLAVRAGYLRVVDTIGEVFNVQNDGNNNCGIELGSQTKPNSPYIDFHSSGKAIDQDARIIVHGGTGTQNNTGIMDILANTINLYAVVHSSGNIIAGANVMDSRGWMVASPAGSIQDLRYNQNYLHVTTAGYGSFAIAWGQSDISLKKNIVDSQKDSLSKIMQIQHKQFDWKDGRGHVSMGWIAQDLQKIDDELVIHVKQEDGSELLQPSHPVILPHITRAIQQQQEIIENLKLKITMLESRLST